jgi:hypothetical protein
VMICILKMNYMRESQGTDTQMIKSERLESRFTTKQWPMVF